jgi:hypothetical protein
MHLVGIIYLKSHYVPIHHIVESFRVSDSMSVVSYVCFQGTKMNGELPFSSLVSL